MKRETAKDRMTQEVVTITPEVSLPEAHRLMGERQIRHLPVMKNDNLVGIVTLGDVREAEPSDATSLNVWEMNYLVSKIKVEQIMTRNPVTVYPYTTINEVAQLLQEKKIGSLPVVEQGGKVVGIITEDDIFRMVIEEWGPKAHSTLPQSMAV